MGHHSIFSTALTGLANILQNMTTLGASKPIDSKQLETTTRNGTMFKCELF